MGTVLLRPRAHLRRRRPPRVLRGGGQTQSRLETRRRSSPITPSFLAALYIVFLAHRGDLLALDARRRIFTFLCDYPGLHLREIARGTKMDPNHVKYHLTALEKHGLVSSRKEEGYWRFWPKEDSAVGQRERLSPDDKKVLALLRRQVPLHIVLLLLEHGETNQKVLTERIGIAQSTLSYHIKKMEKSGLLRVRKEGRERVYALEDHERINALLMQYRPPDALVHGFLDAWEQLEL